MKEAGLLERQQGRYLARISCNLLLMAAGWAAVPLAGDSWWQLLTAIYLAFCYVQSGLLMHDAGHLQMFRRRGVNLLAAYLHGNLLMGVSAGLWIHNHNRHHGHPNHPGKDPAVMRRATVFAAGENAPRVGAVRRLISGNLKAVYFPIHTLAGVNMRITTLRTLVRRAVPRVAVESILVAVHFVAYFGLLFAALTPSKAVAFVVVHHAVSGLYLGAVFAPNHKGMPMMDDEEPDWVVRQIVTARNVRCSAFVGYLFGGLNYQIEHHLFPTMPRGGLRNSRSIVMGYCEEAGIPYHEVGLLQSYREIFDYLSVESAAWRETYAGRSVGLTSYRG